MGPVCSCPPTGRLVWRKTKKQPQGYRTGVLDKTVVGSGHAQKADRKGNVLIWGILGVQKEAVLAAKRAIVTVEEIVDDLKAPPNAVVLPSWVIDAVCHVPGGAHPSFAQGYSTRDNRFYKEWDAISRERDGFLAWMERHVLGTRDFAEYRRSLEGAS